MSKFISAKKMAKKLLISEQLFWVLLSEKGLIHSNLDSLNLGIDGSAHDDCFIQFDSKHGVVFDSSCVVYFEDKLGIKD